MCNLQTAQLQLVATPPERRAAVAIPRVQVAPGSLAPAAQDLRNLELAASLIAKRGEAVGLPVEYLGIEPLFGKARLYHDPKPWVICPAKVDPLVSAGLPIPMRQRKKLTDLVEAGMNFPHLYLAHEVPGGLPLPGRPIEGEHVDLDAGDVARLVVRPAAPSRSLRTAERLNAGASAAGRVVTGAAMVAGMAALAPLALLDGLDPAVLGAITAPGSPLNASAPAAWFQLVSWKW